MHYQKKSSLHHFLVAVITRTWQAAATVWQAKQKQQQQKAHQRKVFLDNADDNAAW